MEPPVATRQRMKAPQRREQLLVVATELAIERGFHGVSVEAVARRAGVTRAVIYQHFGDLQALLQGAIERAVTRALAQVSESAMSDLSHGDAKELMLESLEAYLRAVADHPSTWQLVLMPPAGAPEFLRESIAKGRQSVLTQLTQAVQPALLGEERSDGELTARLLSAVSDEYARLILTNPGQYSRERLLRHARWWLDQSTFGVGQLAGPVREGPASGSGR